MARVKTFVNGGSLLPGDLNSIQDDYEFAFSSYEGHLVQRDGVDGNSSSTTQTLPQAGANTAPVPVLFSGIGFYFDPADYAANTRTIKFRVRYQLLTNATAPAINFTAGLYPVGTFAGGAGAPTIATLGTVVTGSTVAINAPGSTTQNQANSGDFTAPAAGYYLFAVAKSGSQAAGASVVHRVVLQMRRV